MTFADAPLPTHLEPKPRTTLNLAALFTLMVLLIVAAAGGYIMRDWAGFKESFSNSDLLNPLTSQTNQNSPDTSLQKYAIPKLGEIEFELEKPLAIIKKLNHSQSGSSPYLFTYQSQGKTISGQINIPDAPAPAAGYPVIVMSRGYAPPENYYTGFGTKSSAAVYAREGYVTIAPDFLGFGESDEDYENTWEGRFVKPVNVVELIATVTRFPEVSLTEPAPKVSLNPKRIGLWGHSNGGQITLATLEGLSEPIPATIWAPVTAPFPYSILFFGNDLPDEGKAQRSWIALLEKDYDVFDFSVTKHVSKLTGPLQIHHGAKDDLAPISWSNLFTDKIKTENKLRAQLEADAATMSAELATELIGGNQTKEIQLNYFKYPAADHNMRPDWNTVVARDLEFFAEHL
jgi:dienelactone hydrolase